MMDINRKRELFDAGSDYGEIKYTYYGTYDCRVCGEMFESYVRNGDRLRTIDTCIECLGDEVSRAERLARAIFAGGGK